MGYTAEQIKFMENNGYKPSFNWKDEMEGRTTTEKPPHFPVSFRKEINSNSFYCVWALKEGHQTATVINGQYRDHKPCLSLEDAVKIQS